MVKIYLDASVIIPAILSPDGGSAKLIKFVKLGLVAGVTSQNVIEEIERNCVKIHKSPREIRQFIHENLVLVRKKINSSDIASYKDIPDTKDAHIIAAALLTKCAYLATLDKKHLLRGNIKNLFLPLCIVSPKKLLEEIVFF